jgi:hypothetical protein
MNSSRRWLIIFAIVISILVIATVSLVLLMKGNEIALLPQDTPQGIVQRYLIAVQEKNYQKAYNYLSFEPSQKIKAYDDWLRMVIGAPQISDQPAWKATLGKTIQNGDNVTVEVIIDTFRPGGPFEDLLRSQQIIFQLSKIDGNWLITSPAYIYWIY